MTEHVEILRAIHEQLQKADLELGMSPNERVLANAILVTLNVLIDERAGKPNGKSLVGMLTQFSNSDLGDLPAYAKGEWSMRNLEAMIGDLMRRENK